MVCVQEKHAGLPEASVTGQRFLQLSGHRLRRERTPDGPRDSCRGLVCARGSGGVGWILCDMFFRYPGG